MVIDESAAQLEIDPGFIAFTSVEAVVHSAGIFDSKDHIKRCLFALNEPLIDHKIDYGTRGIYRNSKGQIVVESKVIETDLGWALEQALKHRKPKVFFIDEAHHMLMLASGRKLTDLPEAIKSLANRTGVMHGLIGTYELLTLHDVGDQLSRRSVYLHFPRYHADIAKDREIFQSIVWGFSTSYANCKRARFNIALGLLLRAKFGLCRNSEKLVKECLSGRNYRRCKYC